jgi:hypothetical protein
MYIKYKGVHFKTVTEVSLRNIIILIWVGTTVVGRGSWLTLTSETLEYLMQLTS